MNPLGQPLPHESAREHVCGEAVFVDDMPPIRGELIVDIVGSHEAFGKIVRIDVNAARQVSGILAVLTAADVPHNRYGPVFHDEDVLADGQVVYRGQPIVALAGETREAVAAAAKLVAITIESSPPILSIDDAIVADQFIGPVRTIARGNADVELAGSPHRLTGELRIGGQEHFYLEAQAAIAIPGEAGQIVVHSSTQNPTEIQALVARVLGVNMAQVSCVCRRMGGGFGGKETQAAAPAVLAALVAFRTGRAARCVYRHEQDFCTTGKRHPYLVRYDVGFDDDGRIRAYRAAYYSNGGCSADLSLAVMERTLLHGENAYYIPNIKLTGQVCRTNLPSNTAFRGFGGPQAVAAMEHVIEDIAATLGRDSYEIRQRNCYGIAPKNVTPYGQVVANNTLPDILERLHATSEYAGRRAAIEQFNCNSRTQLRGIAMTPVKFGISFTRKSMNQASALVLVLTDGTVQVSTGGTEMGQGLNTKIRQLVAAEFALPVDVVRVMPTSTERNHNTSPTAASASTDLNGSAAVQACREIVQRLNCVARASFNESDFRAVPFTRLVQTAHELRVDLGGRGFYATPGIDFDRETGQGSPFLYYTNGAAVAEVLINRLFGDVSVQQIDVLMDLGRMINPAIDRGQVVGGFVQGMGWVTTEALIFDGKGRLLSDSATTYKIPNVTDVPERFRVDFLDNPENTANIYSSKAVGEPPLLLAVSVWAAVKHALASARPGALARLDLPATGEEVLMRLHEVMSPFNQPLSPGQNGTGLAAAKTARV